MPFCGGSNRPLGEFAACFINGNDGVRPLVLIDSNDDHVPCLPRSWGLTRTGRRTHLSWGDATLLTCQVTSAGPLNVRRPAKWITATHTAGGDSASQAAGHRTA